MRPQASSAPVVFQVHRRFEANRLAGDCQARAYEQVVPIAGEGASASTKATQAECFRVEIESLQAEGVAA
jgi:hypothetical protein